MTAKEMGSPGLLHVFLSALIPLILILLFHAHSFRREGLPPGVWQPEPQPHISKLPQSAHSPPPPRGFFLLASTLALARKPRQPPVEITRSLQRKDDSSYNGWTRKHSKTVKRARRGSWQFPLIEGPCILATLSGRHFSRELSWSRKHSCFNAQWDLHLNRNNQGCGLINRNSPAMPYIQVLNMVKVHLKLRFSHKQEKAFK